MLIDEIVDYIDLAVRSISDAGPFHGFHAHLLAGLNGAGMTDCQKMWALSLRDHRDNSFMLAMHEMPAKAQTDSVRVSGIFHFGRFLRTYLCIKS